MVRRVVTGNNADGKSYFVSDEEISDRQNLWLSAGGQPYGESPDGSPMNVLPATALHTQPSHGSIRVAFPSVPPWEQLKHAFASGVPGYDELGFHRTESVVYIMIVNGEITLALDEGEKVLRPGDLVIQRNTNHTWYNYGDTPVDFWAVVVSAKPAA